MSFETCAIPIRKCASSAVRLLREVGIPGGDRADAALVQRSGRTSIQLEAIDAELSFFLVEDVPVKKRVALVVEVRQTAGRAPAAFELGPFAVWPVPVPAELIDALLQAVDDENTKVRIEAIYTLGVIARAPFRRARCRACSSRRSITTIRRFAPGRRASSAASR